MQLPVLWPVSVSTRTLTSQGIGFLETLKNPANLFKNNLNNTRNNMKSQIQNKKNGGIGELLITLNKIIRNQGTYFVVTMNNRLKIISVIGIPLQSMEWFFQKKAFHERTKTFLGKKNYGEVVLNRRTNDPIIPRFKRSFIIDKCIFH